jgi:hypothetical protein
MTERVLALCIVALVVLGMAALAKGEPAGVTAAIAAIAAVLPGARPPSPPAT